MLAVLQIVTVIIVAFARGLALAHALLVAGKDAARQENLLRRAGIYYPGFTNGSDESFQRL
jgi:hypothetical protein